jgi:hypothetical protein
MFLEKKRSKLAKAALKEAIIILALTLLIIVTLNYFGMVPLSRNFPALTFLPVSGSLKVDDPKDEIIEDQKNLQTRSIVPEENPLVLTHSGDTQQAEYPLIEQSAFKPVQDMVIDLDLSAEPGSEGSGIMFGSNFPSQTLRRILYLTYYSQGKTWILRFENSGKSVQANIPVSEDLVDKIRAKFTIRISQNGKVVYADIGQKDPIKLNLPSTLYDPNAETVAVAQIPSSTTLKINLLKYSYR